jgi:hypothetical protein
MAIQAKHFPVWSFILFSVKAIEIPAIEYNILVPENGPKVSSLFV